jgi:predicted branched-subunit amino acid permease
MNSKANEKLKLNFKKGLSDGLPIGLGYLSVSFAFGVQASLLGIPVLMSVFISMTNLTSAGQLAGLSVIAALGTFLEIALTQLVINARYFLMSISLSQKLDDSFSLPKRFLFSAFITDEIFAVASSKKSVINTKYFLGLVVLPYCGWSLGTLLGAALGNILPLIIANSLGIALYAMFIAIIIPPSFASKGVLSTVIVALGISCAFYYLPYLNKLSQGIAIIITAVLTSAIMAFIFPIKEVKKDA